MLGREIEVHGRAGSLPAPPTHFGRSSRAEPTEPVRSTRPTNPPGATSRSVSEFFDRLQDASTPAKTAGMHNSYLFDIDGAGQWLVAVDDGSIERHRGRRRGRLHDRHVGGELPEDHQRRAEPDHRLHDREAQDQGRYGRGDEVAETVLNCGGRRDHVGGAALRRVESHCFARGARARRSDLRKAPARRAARRWRRGRLRRRGPRAPLRRMARATGVSIFIASSTMSGCRAATLSPDAA